MVDTGAKDNKSWHSGIGDWFSGGGPGRAGRSAQAGISGSSGAQAAGKATGLSPYMSMFGMAPQGPAAAEPSAGKAGGTSFGGMWDVLRGKGQSWGTGVSGEKSSNGFEQIKNADGSSGGYKMPSVANWNAVGRSGGNRQTDLDYDHKNQTAGFVKDGGNEVDGNQMVAQPEIYQPDLSGLDHKTTGTRSISSAKETSKGSGKYENLTGAGSFTDTAWGSKTTDPSWGLKTKIDPLTGKGQTSIASGGYVAGGEYKTGYRAGAMSDDKRYTANAEGGFVASGGVSGQYGIDTKNGLYATGGIGGKVGLYGEANADAKTESVKFGGVDYDAGIGAHAEVFAGAKAGMGGSVGLGPDFIGAKGNIGAFVGAEAAADIHGNLGPLAGKVGASGMVGAGIGADGDISFKDGKFHIGGKMFAALGYGGSLSADMTVDVGAIGKSAYNLGAAGIDWGGKALTSAGKGIGNAYNATSKAVGNAWDSTTKTVGNAYNNTTKAVGNAYNGATKAVGNAYNGATNWAGKQASNIATGATNMYNSASQGVSNAASAVSNTASNMYNGASSAVSNGISNIASW